MSSNPASPVTRITPPSDSKIYLDLTGLPWSHSFLLTILKSCNSNLDTFDISTTTIQGVNVVPGTDRPQSTSHSAVMEIVHKNDNKTTTSTIYLKKIAAIDIDKPYPDLRRNICYARNELTFYKTCQTACNTPRLLHSVLNTKAIGDHDVSDPPGPAPADLTGVGGILVLEPVNLDPSDSSSYFQKSPLTIPEVKLALKTFAKLHASHWNSPNLTSLNLQRHGGSYALPNRNPTELKKVSSNFKKFCSEFSPLNPSFYTSSILSVGRRLEESASFISSSLLSPSPFKTLIHGDSKSLNTFLSSSHPSLLIDFASAGPGHGMSDVSMTLVHALKPGYEEENLIDYYIEVLKGEGVEYSKDQAMEHFNLGLCDYARFMLGRFWGSSTPATFEGKKDNENVALVNRDIECAEQFIKRVEEALTSLNL
ncbi:hypothetical protein TrST_g5807 [Triparma strigata]|uniref:CHK kinase-like domain-containing protein n=1 Tax=Triparma strigata TaxID=1606541 RepID=A0A9W7BVY0_9STRA|nr:hypothetical protein TrST_g5807 [Triparma strigata]